MAIQIDPPKSLHLLDIQQTWHKLIKALNSQLTDTGWGNILFVDINDGNDASAQRGSLTFKYATIQAALDAAQPGDAVWVGPGAYAEQLTWPNTDNVSLIGLGPQSVSILSDEALVPALTVAPTAAVASLLIQGIVFINSASGVPLVIDGTNNTQIGNNGRVYISECASLTAGGVGLLINVCGDTRIQHTDIPDAGWVFTQVSQVIVDSCRMGGLYLDNDPTGVEPDAGFGLVTLNSVTCGDIAVNNLGLLACTDDVQSGDLTSTLTDTATASGAILHSGRITGDVNVTFNFDDLAGQIPLILDYCRIAGTFLFGASDGGSNEATCRAMHATFYNTDASSITVDSLGILDIRGSQYALASLVGTDTLISGTAGVANRTDWYMPIVGVDVVNGAAGYAATIDPAYPTGQTAYTVVFECSDQSDDAGGWAILNKAEDAVTVLGTNGGGAALAGTVRIHLIQMYG